MKIIDIIEKTIYYIGVIACVVGIVVCVLSGIFNIGNVEGTSILLSIYGSVVMSAMFAIVLMLILVMHK